MWSVYNTALCSENSSNYYGRPLHSPAKASFFLFLEAGHFTVQAFSHPYKLFFYSCIERQQNIEKIKTSKTTFNNGLPQVKQDLVKPIVTRWNCSICQNSSICWNCSICSKLLKIAKNLKKENNQKVSLFWKIHFTCSKKSQNMVREHCSQVSSINYL